MPASLGGITPWEFETYGGQHHWRVVTLDFGNGHREASIAPYRTLAEPPPGWSMWGGWKGGTGAAARGSGDREASVRRATRRSKTEARKRCKGSGFDSLFTFTYRANVTDRDLVAAHWKECVRRIRRVLPDFAYLAVLERQERGAYHLHVATHRLPATLAWAGVKVKSWNVLRSIWRSVVGELGGNFDESKRRRRSRASSLRVARYITKYIAKDFEDGELNRKRYWAGGEWQAPERVAMLFERRPGDRMSAELLELVFGEVVRPGAEFSHWLHTDGTVYWVAALGPS